LSTPLNRERFFKPSLELTELLKNAAGGQYHERGEYVPFMMRALVLGVDPYGGRLETPSGEPEVAALTQEVRDEEGAMLVSYTVPTKPGPRNPKGSIKARILSGQHDEFVADDDLRVYWPLFPGAETPSPGELVYVVFEDADMTHGLWLARVPNNLPEDRVNHVLVSTQLNSARPKKGDLFGAKQEQETDVPPNGGSRRLTNLFVG
jgi:hypothetical protein